MYRSIATLLSVGLLLAGQTAAAQSSMPPPPIVAAGPAPAVPWCPPGQTRTAAGKCVAAAPGTPQLVGQQTIDGRSVPVFVSTPKPAPTVYQTVNGVRTAVAGPGAAAPQPAKPVAKPPAPVLAAKPVAPTTTTYAKPPAAGIAAAPLPAAKPARFNIAVGEPNGDCTTRTPNLIHDSRSPGGCAPCPRGRVPNAAHQACVIPIPRRY